MKKGLRKGLRNGVSWDKIKYNTEKIELLAKKLEEGGFTQVLGKII